MTLRGTRRWAACLLVGSALLGGCSDERPASGTLPEASPSTPTTEAALEPLGPADLPMPAEARTQDAAGAQAFVRYYIALINRTSTVMDAAPLREFSSGCRDCERIASAVEGDAEAGYSYSGGQVSIIDLGEPLLRSATAEIAMRANIAALSVHAPDGTVAEELSSRAYTNLSGGAALSWDSARASWLMRTLTLE
ncbi:hypothetical protein ACI8AC_01425 [Geodermatophilus sp. SYSU D00758]